MSISISINPRAGLDPKRQVYNWQVVECRSAAELAAHVAGSYTWSPIVFKDNDRHENNFLSTQLCVLDFDGEDEKEFSVAQTVDFLSYYKIRYVIAPTKSHQLDCIKKGVALPPRDRYRLILFFAHTITNLKEYKYNMKLIAHRWGSDRSCVDGARFFYPSRMISGWAAGKLLPIQKVPPKIYIAPEVVAARRAEIMGRGRRYNQVPHWVYRFLDSGIINGKGRQETCFKVACRLFERGYSADEIERLIQNAPFSREKPWSEGEITHAVRNAAKLSRVPVKEGF